MSARPLPMPINPALLKHADQRRQHLENRIADQITRFAGSMLFVYLHMTTAEPSAPSGAQTITEHELAQCQRANQTGRTPVVFEHGLWVLPSSWDRWATLFEDNGYTTLTPGWPDDPETAAVMAAAQRPYAAAAFAAAPSGPPAWKTLPCWYLLGTQDQAIPPALQRFMAERANATIVEVAASHVWFVSQPEAATQLILQAIEATAAARP